MRKMLKFKERAQKYLQNGIILLVRAVKTNCGPNKLNVAFTDGI